jgi:hypothetical protein
MRLQKVGVVRTGCPAPDMLIAAGEGVLPECFERSIQLHLNSCWTCTVLRRELTTSPLSEPTLEETTRVRQRIKAGMRARSLGMKYAAFAAGVAIVLMVPFVWEQEKPVAPLRDNDQSTSVRAATGAPIVGCLPPIAKAPLRLPLATAMVVRGPSGADEQEYLRELGSALASYRTDDFENASARLKRLASRYPRRVEPVFYLGVALLMGGDATAAAKALESAKRIGSEELAADIATYLSRAQQAAACNLAQQ